MEVFHSFNNKGNLLLLRRRLALFLFIIVMTPGCILGEKKLVVNFKNPSTFENLKTGIETVKVENNQLVITGNGLSNIKNVKLKGNSGEELFNVESASATQIITNSVRNMSIGVGQVFDLILADAYGSATYQVAFSLDNRSITAPMLGSMGATSGQILKYNGSEWAPANLAASQVYLGTWNATSNSPDITSNLTQFQNGDYYIVTTAGTFNAAPISTGDWVMFNGTAWEKIDNSSNVVASFKGRRGAVTPQNNDYTWSQITKTGSRLQDIADVDIATRNDGDVLVWNATNSNWVSSASVGSPAPGSITATQLANSSVTYAKLNLADGDIPQAKVNGLATSLSGKEATVTAGTTSQYYRGDKTWQTLDSSVVTENTNLYFTNARVLGVALTGFDDSLTGAVSSSDSVLTAFGRAQKQINTINTNASSYVTKTGTSTVSGTIDARTGFVLVGTPGTANDATPKTYVDTQIASLVAKSGDTMTGSLVLAKTDVTTSGTGYGLQITPTYNQVTSSSANTDLFINRTETSLGSGNQYLIDARVGGVTKFNITNTGITSTSSLRLNGATSGYVGFAPASNAGSTIYTLPAADGTSGYVLSTNGTGTLSWIAASGGVSSQWTTNGSNINYSTGSVGIGVASPGYALDVSGSIRATSFLYSSDRRLKKNILPIEDPMQKLLDLNGVMFDWKKTGEPAMGFIAQEVEKVVPAVVKTDKVSKYKSVQYANLVALIVEAFKTFYLEVESHFTKVDRSIEGLEQENDQLKKQVQSQQEQIDQLAKRLENLEK